jgi:phenylpropionate dioxygenase-like ring-hydroxylating dioxygenase large terminal subunit
MQEKIAELIKDHQVGYSLEQAFYTNNDIYHKEIENVFLKHWILAGHVSQIPEHGDFFLVEFDKESVIVTRNKKGEINAMLNVCRHRGSHICLEPAGNAKSLTCPYHAWNYNLDGQLVAARNMDDQFDKSANGLHRVHLELVGGLIFISLAEQPLSLETMRADLAETFELLGFDKMKLAQQKTYPIPANWKLAVENYQECYHCTPSHREYSEIHALALPPAKLQKNTDTYLKNKTSAIRATPSDCYFDLAKQGDEGYQYSRDPLLPGMKSGTLGGQPASRLLGNLTDYDGGSSDFMVGPLTFFLIYDDHMVGYRFLPLSIDKCVCDIFWFVHEEAEEGNDYDLEQLTWLWDVTTQADKEIILNNQKGVDSRFYRPGKLSEMEDFQQNFLNWYVQVLKQ